MRLGEKVRVLREARGLGQSELAERVGIHQVTLSQWERGTRPFDGDYLEAVASALEVDPGLFHSASPWGRLEEARRQYDAAVEEVQHILNSARDSHGALTNDSEPGAAHIAESSLKATDDFCSQAVSRPRKVLALTH